MQVWHPGCDLTQNALRPPDKHPAIPGIGARAHELPAAAVRLSMNASTSNALKPATLPKLSPKRM